MSAATQVRGAWDPWLSGLALLVLAVVGLWVRRKFEKREDDGPPPVPPHDGAAPHDEPDDEDRTPA